MRRTIPGRLLLASLVAWGALAAVRPAHADTPTAPSPEAVAFFDEGRRLMAAGNFAAAIPKLEQSLKATRTVGAQLNLGRCYEETGRVASAWASYRAGAALARELHDGREADANRFADAVRPRVSTLTIDARAVEGVEGLDVTLDGVAVGPGARGEAMPIDPGRHVVDVTAPGKKKQTLAVEVRPNAARASLTLSALEDAPTQPAAQPATVPAQESSSTSRTVGWVVGGAGVIAAGVGVVTGLMAIAKHSEAMAACSTYPDHCDPSGAADAPNQASQSLATISTTAFVIGGVALATGVVLVLTAPRAPSGSQAALRIAPLLGPGVAGANAGVVW